MLLSAFADPDSLVMAQSEASWAVVIYLWLIFSGFVVLSHERLQASIRWLCWLSLALAVVSMFASGYVAFRFGEPTFGTALYSLKSGLRALSAWSWALA